MHYDVVIIGAGAAGMMAAAIAARRNRRVLVLEKANKVGVKILMSGGTRCNLTHATNARGIADGFPRDQGRFLRGPLAAFDPDSLVDHFAALGVATKVESTGKIFPRSDKALDVQRALANDLVRASAELSVGEAVLSLQKQGEVFVVETVKRTIVCERVLLTTGGQSYPGCGTTGDGYAWAKSLGHTILHPRPALVPIKTSAGWMTELQGITLPSATVTVGLPDSRKPLTTKTNSLLFTHFGLSGPGVLDASRELTMPNRPISSLQTTLDLLPNSSRQQLDDWFSQAASHDGKRHVVTEIASRLPRRVAESVVAEAKLPLSLPLAEFSQHQRRRLIEMLKQAEVPVTGTLGFAKAEVTAGGVSLDEVDSRNMQSKVCQGLYLAGEILDLDGPIGGYNFQAAFSTGWLAGNSV